MTKCKVKLLEKRRTFQVSSAIARPTDIAATRTEQWKFVSSTIVCRERHVAEAAGRVRACRSSSSPLRGAPNCRSYWTMATSAMWGTAEGERTCAAVCSRWGGLESHADTRVAAAARASDASADARRRLFASLLLHGDRERRSALLFVGG